jgi:hypothetical protein
MITNDPFAGIDPSWVGHATPPILQYRLAGGMVREINTANLPRGTGATSRVAKMALACLVGCITEHDIRILNFNNWLTSSLSGRLMDYARMIFDGTQIREMYLEQCNNMNLPDVRYRGKCVDVAGVQGNEIGMRGIQVSCEAPAFVDNLEGVGEETVAVLAQCIREPLAVDICSLGYDYFYEMIHDSSRFVINRHFLHALAIIERVEIAGNPDNLVMFNFGDDNWGLRNHLGSFASKYFKGYPSQGEQALLMRGNTTLLDVSAIVNKVDAHLDKTNRGTPRYEKEISISFQTS